MIQIRPARSHRLGWTTFCKVAYALAAASIFALAGCRHGATIGAASHGSVGGGVGLRIGYQKAGPPNLLRIRGDLDRRLAKQGIEVQWLSFPAGPQMLEALSAGSLDLGYMGGAPVIFAQAAGRDLVYAGNTPPDETGLSRGILVAKDSPIRTVHDLLGMRIAIQKGSETQNFLIQALAKGGLNYRQIQPVYLAPPDARPAFDSGAVDAWAIWDPFLAIAHRATGARVLADGKGILSAGSFYISTPLYVRQHADLLRIAFEELEKTADWSRTHPHEAAVVMAPEMGLDPTVLEEINRRPQPLVAIRPVDAGVVEAQQQVADNFFRIGLIPRRVDVRDRLLTPQQYQALLPNVRIAGAAGVAKQ